MKFRYLILALIMSYYVCGVTFAEDYTIKASVEDGAVTNLSVPKELRRQGLATHVVEALEAKHGTLDLSPLTRTESGAAFVADYEANRTASASCPCSSECGCGCQEGGECSCGVAANVCGEGGLKKDRLLVRLRCLPRKAVVGVILRHRARVERRHNGCGLFSHRPRLFGRGLWNPRFKPQR